MKLSRTRRRLDPASIRLPLIALIDVILFILLYFMLAGTLADAEADLATTLRTEKGGAPATADMTPQTLYVESAGAAGSAQFRVGERVAADRDSLVRVLTQLRKEMGLIIRVKGDVPVSAAAAAIQAAKDAGFAKVSYVPGT